jgi:putative ABC transport system permease protein
MQVGDTLEFNIQGVPLQAQVSSIRTRTRSRLYPFFYFVFPKDFLHDAPQTFFAALHIDRDAIAGLENRIVTAFPNISFINMAETAAQLGDLTRRLTTVVNFFAGFSILAGALIMVGSIFATRLARMREAVYYKILGANSRFILSVFLYEHLLLGLLSSSLAVILAQTAGWGLCRYLFDIGYSPQWPVSLLLILSTTVVIILVGVLSSIGIIRQKPTLVLREQNGD